MRCAFLLISEKTSEEKGVNALSFTCFSCIEAIKMNKTKLILQKVQQKVVFKRCIYV